MSNLLSQASLVMIPSGYKEDVVYSQIPTNGNGDLSFTRASNGTRINSAGLVEVTPWNLLEYSEQFDNGAWTAVNATIVANDAVAPNGTTTADKFTTTSTTTECEVRASNFSILSNVGIPFTTSVYAKKGTANFLRIRNLFSTVTVIERNGWFNLNTGTLGTIDAGQTGTITDVGNGWYRCTLTGLVGSGGNANLLDIGFTNADNTSFPTTSVNGYIWGAQLNIGSTAKPYFPTTDRLNVPRLTYQNGGGGCPSLLLEPQRTNVAQYSNDLSTSPNILDSSTTTANVYISPDGTQNAMRFTETTANDRHGFYQYTSVTAQTYTASIFTKQTGRRYISFISDMTGTQYSSFFDLQTMSVVSSGSGHTCSIQDFGNGWLRLIVTFTATAGSHYVIWCSSINGITNVYTGSTSISQTFYGYQLEAGAYPTSYIPTTSTSATRVADACFKTGISSLIGQSEGVVFADIVPFQFLDGSYIGISDNASPFNRQIFGFEGDSGNTGTLRFYGWYTGGTINCTANQRYKIAMAYANNYFVIYVNGTQVVNQTSGTITGTVSHFGFDSYVATSQNFQGQINQAALFKTRLTNAELASLTTI